MLVLATQVRRPWRAIVLTIALVFGGVVGLALQSEAAVTTFVSYSLTSSKFSIAQGHTLYFTASKAKDAPSASLYVYIGKVDTKGTSSTADDVYQTHSFSFTVLGNAFVVSDTLGMASFDSGPLKEGANDYGRIQMTATQLGTIKSTPGKCLSGKDRTTELTGTVKFNSHLRHLPRVTHQNTDGTLHRSLLKSPCQPDPVPQVCTGSLTLSSNKYDSQDGSSESLSVFKGDGATGATGLFVSFSDPSDTTKPATVTHFVNLTLTSPAFTANTRTLRTAKLDGGPIDLLSGVINFTANAPAESHANGDCPDYRTRAGAITGTIKVDFAVGDDGTFDATTASLTQFKKS